MQWDFNILQWQAGLLARQQQKRRLCDGEPDQTPKDAVHWRQPDGFRCRFNSRRIFLARCGGSNGRHPDARRSGGEFGWCWA